MGAARVPRLVREPQHADPRGRDRRRRAPGRRAGPRVRGATAARAPGAHLGPVVSRRSRVVRERPRWGGQFAGRGDLAERFAVRGRGLALDRRRRDLGAAPGSDAVREVVDRRLPAAGPLGAGIRVTPRRGRHRADRNLVVRGWGVVAPPVRRGFGEPPRRPAGGAPVVGRGRWARLRRHRDCHRHRVRRSDRMDLHRRRRLDARRRNWWRIRHRARSCARRLPCPHPGRPGRSLAVNRWPGVVTGDVPERHGLLRCRRHREPAGRNAPRGHRRRRLGHRSPRCAPMPGSPATPRRGPRWRCRCRQSRARRRRAGRAAPPSRRRSPPMPTTS